MRVNERDDEFCKEIGAKVRLARNRAGLTQVQLSEMVKMKPATLGNIENGHVAPHVTTLKQIATALDKNVKDFL